MFWQVRVVLWGFPNESFHADSTVFSWMFLKVDYRDTVFRKIRVFSAFDSVGDGCW